LHPHRRVRGAAGHVDASATKLDEEEHVQPLQRNRLDREEIDRKHALRLRLQEGTPRELGALAGRTKARLPQDLPHGRGGEDDAEAVQLACYPLVTPARVLTRQPEHQLPDLAADRRPPAATPYVQRRATSRRCQRSSVVGVTRNDRQLDRGNSRLAAAKKTRSLIASCGRLVCRRSTDSSCRNTTISSSLKPSERRQSDTTLQTSSGTPGSRATRTRTSSSEFSGTGARLYGRQARPRRGTESTHPTRKELLRHRKKRGFPRPAQKRLPVVVIASNCEGNCLFDGQMLSFLPRLVKCVVVELCADERESLVVPRCDPEARAAELFALDLVA
jgi:hypothetical protein